MDLKYSWETPITAKQARCQMVGAGRLRAGDFEDCPFKNDGFIGRLKRRLITRSPDMSRIERMSGKARSVWTPRGWPPFSLAKICVAPEPALFVNGRMASRFIVKIKQIEKPGRHHAIERGCPTATLSVRQVSCLSLTLNHQFKMR